MRRNQRVGGERAAGNPARRSRTAVPVVVQVQARIDGGDRHAADRVDGRHGRGVPAAIVFRPTAERRGCRAAVPADDHLGQDGQRDLRRPSCAPMSRPAGVCTRVRASSARSGRASRPVRPAPPRRAGGWRPARCTARRRPVPRQHVRSRPGRERRRSPPARRPALPIDRSSTPDNPVRRRAGRGAGDRAVAVHLRPAVPAPPGRGRSPGAAGQARVVHGQRAGPAGARLPGVPASVGVIRSSSGSLVAEQRQALRPHRRFRAAAADEPLDGPVGVDDRLVAGLGGGRPLGEHDPGVHVRDRAWSAARLARIVCRSARLIGAAKQGVPSQCPLM